MYVVQGKLSDGTWWTISPIRTIAQLIAKKRQHAGKVNWRIVWEENGKFTRWI